MTEDKQVALEAEGRGERPWRPQSDARADFEGNTKASVEIDQQFQLALDAAEIVVKAAIVKMNEILKIIEGHR